MHAIVVHRNTRRRDDRCSYTDQPQQRKIIYTSSSSPKDLCRKTIDHTCSSKILTSTSWRTHLFILIYLFCPSSRFPSPRLPSLIHAHEAPVSSRSRNLWRWAPLLHLISDAPLTLAPKTTRAPQVRQRPHKAPPPAAHCLPAHVQKLFHRHNSQAALHPGLATAQVFKKRYCRS